MNVDGVITSIVNQLVEVLQVPAQMAWQAGIEYTRLSGIIEISTTILTFMFFVCVMYFVHVKLQKMKDKDFIEEHYFYFTIIASLLSCGFWNIADYATISVLKIIYPEPMLIYKIIEKVLN